MSGAQRGNITDVYLSPPRQLPAFMPLPCLSRIVQTSCFYLLSPQSAVATVLSGPTESNADTWSAGLFFIYTNICYFQACILHCSGVFKLLSVATFHLARFRVRITSWLTSSSWKQPQTWRRLVCTLMFVGACGVLKVFVSLLSLQEEGHTSSTLQVSHEKHKYKQSSHVQISV